MKYLNVFLVLARDDISQAYRRSKLGPFWLTIGIAVQIITMGLVFTLIFKTDTREYLPFLTVSIVFWNFISTSISEGCFTFISHQDLIRQINIPKPLYVLRVLLRNMFIMGHNLVILPLVLVFFWRLPGIQILSLVPGLLLLVLNMGWLVWLLGMISTRYRDMPPIISSLTTIAFYVTPVMWYPKLIENNGLAHLLLGLNPVYHWLQIVRLPFLGQWPTLENWGLALLSAGIGWFATLLAYKKYRHMIAYWV